MLMYGINQNNIVIILQLKISIKKKKKKKKKTDRNLKDSTEVV